MKSKLSRFLHLSSMTSAAIPGMVLGVLMFGIINYGLTFLGVQPYWQKIVKGVIILTAVGFDVRKNIRKK